MIVTVPLPDDFARRFGSEAEAGRRALEGLALVEFRAGRLSRAELQEMLEFGRYELDGFLKAHDAIEGFTPEEVAHQVDVLRRHGA